MSPQQESPLRRSFRLCTQEGLLATPFVFLSLPGNLIMASLLVGVLGLSNSYYGLIVSLPAWFNGLQMLVTPALSRSFTARQMTLFFSWINLAFWLVFTLVLPMLPFNNEGQLALALTAMFICISATQSMTGVSWTAWVQEWIPPSLRGHYFGRRNALLGLGTVAFVWLAGRTVDMTANSIHGYQAILAGTAFFRFFSIYMQSRMPTEAVRISRPQPTRDSWWKQFNHMLHERSFMRFVLFGSTMGFWFSFIGPFVPPYMGTVLHMSVGQQSTLMLLSSVASSLVLPFWGRLTDSMGCRQIIGGCLLIWMSSNYLWLIVTPQNTWLLYPMWILGGMMSGGVVLGGFTLMLKLLPAKMKTSGISMHLACTSVAAALGPIVSGIFLEWGQGLGWSMRAIFMGYFIVYPTAIMLSVLLLKKVTEPTHRQFSSGMGAFRSLRQVFIMEGLLTLSNIVPVRRRKVHLPIKNKPSGS